MKASSVDALDALLADIRACRLCAPALPHQPRPVIQASDSAPILLVGQAPGRKVQQSGLPFDDASGDRLRTWLGVERSQFYDPRCFAIAPMGFCYPGTGAHGDLPPRPECAPLWREPLLKQLRGVQLTVLIGQYAIRWHSDIQYSRVRDAVADWRSQWPQQIAVPHPSPRNRRWFSQHPWFEADVVPSLRERVAELLKPIPPRII